MNKARDYANTVELELAGWRVIHIWECEIKIKTKTKREKTLNRLYIDITRQNLNPFPYQEELVSESIAAEPEISYDSGIHPLEDFNSCQRMD